MKKGILISFFAILSLQGINQSLDPVWAGRFQTVLDSVITAQGITGASAGMHMPGKGTWMGVSGISTTGVPVTPDMCFGIGSNTKLFVAVLVEKLKEQGILTLNDPLHQWLPAIPNADSNITVRQLLSHQSGLSDYLGTFWYDSIFVDTSRVYQLQELIQDLPPPLFAAGTGYSYSNTNYVLLAMIIEQATGTSWVQQLRTLILDPLDLDSTFAGGFESYNVPVAHEWYNDTLDITSSPMTSEYTSATAAGAILSTSSEMLQWYTALFNGTIITNASLNEILDFDAVSFYGLGLISWSFFGYDHEAYYHTGGMVGYVSVMYHDKQSGSSICLMTNGGVTDLNAILLHLLDVFYDERPVAVIDAGVSAILSPAQHRCLSTVNPLVEVTNYGSTTINSVTFNMQIDGGFILSATWNGTITPGSTVQVTLPANVIPAGTHTFKCFTSMPNGLPDEYPYNDVSENIIVINFSPGVNAVSEDFEGGAFPPPAWTNSVSSPYQWAISRIAPNAGNASMAKGNYYDPYMGNYQDIELPMINFSSMINPALEFDYAYTNYPGYNDSLRIYISEDCGLTWQTIFYDGGNTLKTAPSTINSFYPSASQWAHKLISLAAYSGDVLIRFRAITGFGNNLYIDNVNVDSFTGNGDELTGSSDVQIFPNPAIDQITVTGLPRDSKIYITDLSGKIIRNEQCNSDPEQINIGELSNGLYFIITPAGTEKLVKM